ncbi:hypothetical protein TCAL_00266 [Tigriopus californicus]|uniref:CWH43-like N-terminal domain-containing protein n=2 Tax=Tigriopus californicus TaxID=6832 RepID=A0A553P4X6_TIGCA|nr:hypothetical protein TCAL_00266 [Tigriopus californicus]|eukprot:TCALIF_00266-PA protein Name:"Similar to CG3876 Post-GPI attachment to proteins factor 2 (Drosophila melanogaster)" AED:0.12 eAED:0.12 QI:0/-1/0/1/-1/1/1/0/306
MKPLKSPGHPQVSIEGEGSFSMAAQVRRRLHTQSPASFSDERAMNGGATDSGGGARSEKIPLLNEHLSSLPRFQAPLLSISFPRFAVVTVSLPLASFVFCIGYSYLYNFRRTTATHCNVWNFAPSISSAVSVFKPQYYVWRLGIALHSAPRLLLARMYYFYYRQGLRGRFRNLARATFTFNVIENLALLLLSFAASKDDFSLHKACFIAFIASSSLYLICSYLIVSSLWWASRTPLENSSLFLKKSIMSVNLATIVLSLYFYYRHNTYCEPGVYSLFSICEYVIVLTNMGYHFTSYYDFHHRIITI